MFGAGSIVFNLRMAGAQVFTQEASQAEQSVKRVGTSSQEAAKQTEELGKKQETAAQKAKRLAAEEEEVARKAKVMADQIKAAQETVGRAAFAIGASVLAMSALTVKAAINWESAWAGVTKTVDGTPEELQAIEDGLRDLSKVLPASHEEIAAVAEAAGQLGVKAKDIVAFTKVMIDLGATTNLTADEAATSLAQFMNVMQTAPQDVDRLGAAVVALGNDGASTERDIVAMSTRIAGAAAIIGLTEGETLGFANALSSVGIEAEAGGSAVSKLMIDIAQAVSAGGDKLDAFAATAGVSSAEFSAAFKERPAEAIALFIGGLGKMNKAGGDVFGTLEKLGQTDVRTTRALLSLSNAGNLLTDSLELGNEAWEDNNALQSEANKRYATTESKLIAAKNSVVDMAIELGTTLLPAVTAVAEGVSDFANFLSGMPEPVQGVIAVLALLVGGVALVGGAALLALPRIVAFRAAVQTLATTAPGATAALKGTAAFLSGPWGLAIAAAMLGVQLLGSYLDSLQASSEEITGSLRGAADAADIFATAGKGKDAKWLGGVMDQLDDLDGVLQDSANQADNFLLRFAGSGNFGAFDTLKQIGTELGTLADTDLPAAQRAFGLLADETNGSEKRLLQLIDAMPDYKDALIKQGLASGEYAETMTDAEKQQYLLNAAQEQGEGSADDLGDAYQAVEEQVDGVVTSIQDLVKELDALNGKNLDASAAAIALEAAYDDFDAALKKNGKTLDITTEKGRDNRSALDDIAQAALDSGQAIVDAGGGYDEYRASLEGSRAQLLQRIADLGITGQAAEDLANEILSIPTESQWTAIVDTDGATAKLNAYKTLLASIIASGNTVGIPVPKNNYQDTLGKADGGKVVYYANGGTERHQAEVARAGTIRVWNEPETEGETYIPHAMSKRPRSTAILAQTADEFGYQLVPKGAQSFADGGRTETAVVATSSPPADRPIYMDGSLVGYLREMARGQAVMVMNDTLRSVR